MALGVLTQIREPAQQSVGYLSEELDLVAKGLPTCLSAVATITLLTLKAMKLTLAQDLIEYMPHNVTGLLTSKGSFWLTDNHLGASTVV